MQKMVNVLAILSFGVSSMVVSSAVYLYINKDSLISHAKREALDSVRELMGTSQLGQVLVDGPSSEVDVTDEALGVDSNPPIRIPQTPF